MLIDPKCIIAFSLKVYMQTWCYARKKVMLVFWTHSS